MVGGHEAQPERRQKQVLDGAVRRQRTAADQLSLTVFPGGIRELAEQLRGKGAVGVLQPQDAPVCGEGGGDLLSGGAHCGEPPLPDGAAFAPGKLLGNEPFPQTADLGGVRIRADRLAAFLPGSGAGEQIEPSLPEQPFPVGAQQGCLFQGFPAGAGCASGR